MNKKSAQDIKVISAVISPEDSELMIEPKRSCNRCYGRGYELWLEGDGYKNEAADGQTVRVQNMNRISRPCSCVFRNARFRNK